MFLYILLINVIIGVYARYALRICTICMLSYVDVLSYIALFFWPSQGRGHSDYHWKEGSNGWWMVSRVPDTSRGRRIRMAQSDGLVRLTILSADGHPKGARGHELARFQQLPIPTAVSPQKSSPLFCAFFHRESSQKTKNRPPFLQNTKTHRF